MRAQPRTYVRKPNSKSLELHFLGPKASLFDVPQPLDPLECPKPSK